ncbi:hypothetical protein E6O75_ATG06015 [Venturia nashicola]|uniref:Uncharacterized protein n=1 Tax=Venturia nashicola TaxID=86259 RepID=A0A4Z1NVB1_9PEZI|nr:hypothetical protein E6O75_ATG06015 [Venturia nashicola]
MYLLMQKRSFLLLKLISKPHVSPSRLNSGLQSALDKTEFWQHFDDNEYEDKPEDLIANARANKMGALSIEELHNQVDGSGMGRLMTDGEEEGFAIEQYSTMVERVGTVDPGNLDGRIKGSTNELKGGKGRGVGNCQPYRCMKVIGLVDA